MAGDWIKLHRKLRRSPIMGHDGLCRLWIHCLMKANWKPNKWLIPGTMKEIEVPRGSFITGRDSLFKELYPKRDDNGLPIRYEYTPHARTLWRWLEALSAMGCLKLENVSNRCTLVSIVKYSVYQSIKDDPCPTDAQLTPSSRPTDAQLTPTIEEREEIQEGEEEERSPAAPVVYGQFEIFWRAYPRKVARDRALAEWERLAPTVELLNIMLAAIANSKRSGQWDDTNFIPYPSSWLSGRRWEDQTEDPKPAAESDIAARWARRKQKLLAGGGEV